MGQIANVYLVIIIMLCFCCRPLPEELIKYARQDTHYLLYVYDVMRNDLLTAANGQTNLLKSVYQSSREICLKVFAHYNIIQYLRNFLHFLYFPSTRINIL